jgi:hypothetical protein
MVANSEWAERRLVRLSRRLSVEMTCGPGGFTCEWDPEPPARLTKAEWRNYRKGRHALLAAVSARLGGRILVLEA